MTTTTASSPLTGTTVVENASFVAAPAACLQLAKLGARVIRIDPIGGGPDFNRWPLTPGGQSIIWHSLNRGKESVTLNMRMPEGKELAQAIITAPGEGRGIFVENSVGRSFLDDDVLRGRRADLIHVRVLGGTQGGPAVDYTVNARAGVPYLTGPANQQEPTNHALPAWDLLCGQAAATAAVTGLLRRVTTGTGVYEEIPLEDVARVAVADLGWYTETLRPIGGRPKIGNNVYGGFGTDYATEDGRVIIVALTPRQWKGLVEATGAGEVFDTVSRTLGIDLGDEGVRFEHRDLVVSLTKPWFAAHSTAEAVALVNEAGGLAAPYRSMTEVADGVASDAPVAGLYRTDGGSLGNLIVGESAIRVDGHAGRADAPVVFGAETERVLAEDLGLSDAEIGGLRDREVI